MVLPVVLVRLVRPFSATYRLVPLLSMARPPGALNSAAGPVPSGAAGRPARPGQGGNHAGGDDVLTVGVASGAGTAGTPVFPHIQVGAAAVDGKPAGCAKQRRRAGAVGVARRAGRAARQRAH